MAISCDEWSKAEGVTSQTDRGELVGARSLECQVAYQDVRFGFQDTEGSFEVSRKPFYYFSFEPASVKANPHREA